MRFQNFVAQVVPFQFQLAFQLLDFFECARVGDRSSGVVGDHPHPRQVFFVEASTCEDGEHAQQLALMNQRLTA